MKMKRMTTMMVEMKKLVKEVEIVVKISNGRIITKEIKEGKFRQIFLLAFDVR